MGFRKPSDVVGADVIAQLDAAGWEVVRKSTEKKRRYEAEVATMRAYWAEVDRDSAHAWGANLAKEGRRLMARCTFLYEKALALGATHAELDVTPETEEGVLPF